MCPTNRGHFLEPLRKVTISLKAYLKFLVLQHHGGFRTVYALQFLYNYLVRHEFWRKIKIQSKKIIDGESCAKLYDKIPEADIHILIKFYKDKGIAAHNRTSMPPLPSGLSKVTQHFLNNVKCVNRLLPHSNETAIFMRNYYNAMMIRHGSPLLWITVNPNCVENKIVLHMITGETLSLPDLSATEKRSFISKSPGSTAVYFQEYLHNVIRYWLGFDPSTGRPTKIGGILPRLAEFGIAVESDGSQSLHAHILAWGFIQGTLKYIFSWFTRCKKHLEIFKERNPCWKYGFCNPKEMERAIILLHQKMNKIGTDPSDPVIVNRQTSLNLSEKRA